MLSCLQCTERHNATPSATDALHPFEPAAGHAADVPSLLYELLSGSYALWFLQHFYEYPGGLGVPFTAVTSSCAVALEHTAGMLSGPAQLRTLSDQYMSCRHQGCKLSLCIPRNQFARTPYT